MTEKWVNGEAVPMTVEEQAEYDAYVIKKTTPAPLSAIEQLTLAVKNLPVDKRTNPVWGLFVQQVLLALNPPDGQPDMEAAAYLITTFQTEDADYLAIIAQAKQLFGLV